jgi:hypothetical protein
MKKTYTLPSFAPRIKAHKIRRLYESDASGLLDAELLNDVGWALHARCDSFLDANLARSGRLRCPVCRELVAANIQSKESLRCACGWECTYRAYMDAIRNQQLDGGPEVIALFQQYRDSFPKIKENNEKMLAIDGLIHGFHHFLRSGRTRRPVGINLIDGHLDFIIDFLDQLSIGPASTPGLWQTQQDWREKVNSSRKTD